MPTPHNVARQYTDVKIDDLEIEEAPKANLKSTFQSGDQVAVNERRNPLFLWFEDPNLELEFTLSYYGYNFNRFRLSYTLMSFIWFAYLYWDFNQPQFVGFHVLTRIAVTSPLLFFFNILMFVNPLMRKGIYVSEMIVICYALSGLVITAIKGVVAQWYDDHFPNGTPILLMLGFILPRPRLHITLLTSLTAYVIYIVAYCISIAYDFTSFSTRCVLFWVELLFFIIIGYVLNYFLEYYFRKQFTLRKRLRAYQQQLEKESRRTERLLRNILPTGMIDKIRDHMRTEHLQPQPQVEMQEPMGKRRESLAITNLELAASNRRGSTVLTPVARAALIEYHPNATVLFSDICNFTQFSSSTGAETVVGMLNSHISYYDTVCEALDLEKVKTVGDAYICAGGISPIINGPKYVGDESMENTLDMAIEMMRHFTYTNAKMNVHLKMRIGIAHGPVIATVVGAKKYTFDCLGATVHKANELEYKSIPGCVHVTAAFYERCSYLYDFHCRETLIDEEPTFILLGKKGHAPITTVKYIESNGEDDWPAIQEMLISHAHRFIRVAIYSYESRMRMLKEIARDNGQEVSESESDSDVDITDSNQRLSTIVSNSQNNPTSNSSNPMHVNSESDTSDDESEGSPTSLDVNIEDVLHTGKSIYKPIGTAPSNSVNIQIQQQLKLSVQRHKQQQQQQQEQQSRVNHEHPDDSSKGESIVIATASTSTNNNPTPRQSPFTRPVTRKSALTIRIENTPIAARRLPLSPVTEQPTDEKATPRDLDVPVDALNEDSDDITTPLFSAVQSPTYRLTLPPIQQSKTSPQTHDALTPSSESPQVLTSDTPRLKNEARESTNEVEFEIDTLLTERQSEKRSSSHEALLPGQMAFSPTNRLRRSKQYSTNESPHIQSDASTGQPTTGTNRAEYDFMASADQSMIDVGESRIMTTFDSFAWSSKPSFSQQAIEASQPNIQLPTQLPGASGRFNPAKRTLSKRRKATTSSYAASAIAAATEAASQQREQSDSPSISTGTPAPTTRGAATSAGQNSRKVQRPRPTRQLLRKPTRKRKKRGPMTEAEKSKKLMLEWNAVKLALKQDLNFARFPFLEIFRRFGTEMEYMRRSTRYGRAPMITTMIVFLAVDLYFILNCLTLYPNLAGSVDLVVSYTCIALQLLLTLSYPVLSQYVVVGVVFSVLGMLMNLTMAISIVVTPKFNELSSLYSILSMICWHISPCIPFIFKTCSSILVLSIPLAVYITSNTFHSTDLVFLVGVVALFTMAMHLVDGAMREAFMLRVKNIENIRSINEQQKQNEELILSALPKDIAKRLKIEPTNTADFIQDGSVLFVKLDGFDDALQYWSNRVRDQSTIYSAIHSALQTDIFSEQFEFTLHNQTTSTVTSATSNGGINQMLWQTATRLSSIEIGMVNALHQIFVLFDELTSLYGCVKIKSAQDTYLVVCGCPYYVEDHVLRITKLATQFLVCSKEYIDRCNKRISEEELRDRDRSLRMGGTVPVSESSGSLSNSTSPTTLSSISLHRTQSITSARCPRINIKIGLHKGPFVAGVLGRSKFLYDVFGDTINVAARMCTTCEPGRIQCTYDMYKALAPSARQNQLLLTERGTAYVKGKGQMMVYNVSITK